MIMIKWQDYIGKRVMVLIRNSKFPYVGVIKEIQDDKNGLIFVTLIDKTDSKIIFAAGEIAFIREEK